MPERLSTLAETLTGSEIVRLGNEINERIRNGEKIYNYTIGDFNPFIFPIPKQLEHLIIDAYQKNYTNYPPANGIPELREAVSCFIKSNHDIEYNGAEVLIASGGRPLIYTLFKSIIDAGDKVIYAVPSWNNNHYTHLNNGKHCVIETTRENNFMPLAKDIQKHVADAVLICLCTPQNPTGTTLQKEELEKICDMILEENEKRGNGEKKIYLMFDQMYHMLTYGDNRHYNPVSLRPAIKKYTIFIDGISKVFAATGVRVGWAFGPEFIITKMKAILTHIGAWAPMAEQKAVATFLNQPENVKAYLAPFKAALEDRLNTIYNGFIALKKAGYPVDAVPPQAGIYLTIKLGLVGKIASGKKLESQADVTYYILNEAKLAVVPFYAFGASGQSPWYRLSVGTCKIEEIEEMFEKLESALQKLN
jgi:aspartate aminotransferase